MHAPIARCFDAAKPAATADSKAAFKNDDQAAYALGTRWNGYMEIKIQEQEEVEHQTG